LDRVLVGFLDADDDEDDDDDAVGLERLSEATIVLYRWIVLANDVAFRLLGSMLLCAA
jgi:hypothetical protein